MKKFSGRGFTLIELLVVIAIIGILASIVLASLDTARKKGRDARRIADIKQVQLALELYYDANNSSYPVGTWAALTAALTPAYISALPTDPTGGATYTYTYQSTDGASAPTACGTAPCLGYILKAVTETTNTVSAITNAQAPTGWTCTTGSTAAQYNYCVRP